MALLSLLGILSAGAGAVKWHNSYKNNQEANKIIDSTTSQFNAAKSQYDRAVQHADNRIRMLSNLRLKSWHDDIAKYLSVRKKFSGINLKKKTSDNNSSNFTVANPIQLNTLQKISTTTTDLVVNGTVSVTSGALAMWGIYGLVSEYGIAATTGTAIASLSGAAKANATLAFLGGGALKIGGGGMAAGSSALTGFGLGVGLGVSGLVAEYQSQKKLEEVQYKSNQYMADISYMNNLSKACNHIATISDRYMEYQNSFATIFRKLIYDSEQIFNVAVKRRNWLAKLVNKNPVKISKHKLNSKELLTIQLMNFTAQVYYALISIPLTDNNYHIENNAVKMLGQFKSIELKIKSIMSDINTMTDDDFRKKYFKNSADKKTLLFDIPKSIDIIYQQKILRRKRISNIFYNFFALIIILISISIIGLILYNAYLLHLSWSFYLFFTIITLFIFPFPIKYKFLHKISGRIFRLIFGILAGYGILYIIDATIAINLYNQVMDNLFYLISNILHLINSISY